MKNGEKFALLEEGRLSSRPLRISFSVDIQ